jgi:inorganic pyrophosphatase
MADMTPGPNPPDEIYVMVHVSSGSRFYYSMEKGVLTISKAFASPLTAAYGLIPGTHHTDAEQLDALVLVSEPPMPCTLMPARPIGLVRLEGDGRTDDKILAVCSLDKEFEGMEDVSDVPKRTLSQLTDSIKEDWVTKITWLDAAKAKRAIEKAIELYKRENE